MRYWSPSFYTIQACIRRWLKKYRIFFFGLGLRCAIFLAYEPCTLINCNHMSLWRYQFVPAWVFLRKKYRVWGRTKIIKNLLGGFLSHLPYGLGLCKITGDEYLMSIFKGVGVYLAIFCPFFKGWYMLKEFREVFKHGSRTSAGIRLSFCSKNY
jgi:hypothetical protein